MDYLHFKLLLQHKKIVLKLFDIYMLFNNKTSPDVMLLAAYAT